MKLKHGVIQFIIVISILKTHLNTLIIFKKKYNSNLTLENAKYITDCRHDEKETVNADILNVKLC